MQFVGQVTLNTKKDELCCVEKQCPINKYLLKQLFKTILKRVSTQILNKIKSQLKLYLNTIKISKQWKHKEIRDKKIVLDIYKGLT